MKWIYGITTVPARRETLLARTLASLKAAGFDRPRLFVDGAKSGDMWERAFNLEVTTRLPPIRTAGNWILALAELYLREPLAERYAIFQDDLISSKNLRFYLDKCHYPESGYWNLYTFPRNQALVPNDSGGKPRVGWHLSDQLGKGAVGLVFDCRVVKLLLGSGHLWERVPDPTRGWRNIDGGVLTAMKKAKWQEYIHHPSLVQHVGEKSTIDRPEGPVTFPQAVSFRGEDFDCLELLKKE